VQWRRVVAATRFVDRQHSLEMRDEPRIDLREFAHFVAAHAALERLKEPVKAIRPGDVELFAQQCGGDFGRRPPGRARLERADRFAQRLLERAADGHHFADGLHLRGEGGVAAGKFLELKLGNFRDHVIDGRLEGAGRLAGDVVGNLVEGHAQGELCRDLRDREPGGLTGQRGTARNAGIHLDHGHAARFRIDGELDVRAARLDADRANNGGGRVAHALVFLVGERLRGSDGDRIAGVNAHGIEIFDRADDDEVVAAVAHHFELVFLPADDGFLDERLAHRARVERAGDRVDKFLVVVGDRAAGAAERERGADHNRVAELVGKLDGLRNIGDDGGRRNFEADLAANVLEEQAIFGDA
jgi:hypothetical protein